MKYFSFLFVVFFLLFSSIAYSQWTEENSIPGRSIQVFNFLDDNLGYALMTRDSDGEITLEKTSNGGGSWIELNLPVQDVEFQDIHFYEDGKGVLLIREPGNNVNPTKLYQTADDGLLWQEISPQMTETGVGVGQCLFLDQDTGFFATKRSLYMTQDGGLQWKLMEFSEYILSLDFIDAEHGILGTWDGTFAYKGGMLSTANGGESWTETLLDEHYTSIGKVQYMSDSLVYAAPIHSWASIQAGRFYKSTDGGSSWNIVSIPTPFENSTLRQVHFYDEMNGVICVGDHSTTFIYHTSDGGLSWEYEGSFSSNYDTDMQLTANSGYISGDVGTFYRRAGSTLARELLTDVVSLYPSPVRAGQTINWISPTDFSALAIINSAGKKVHQQALDQKHFVVPNLSAGLYLIRLWNDKTEVSKKLYVE